MDHDALLKRVGYTGLVDVGNGQSVRDPVPLDGDIVPSPEGAEYRVASRGDSLALEYREPQDAKAIGTAATERATVDGATAPGTTGDGAPAPGASGDGSHGSHAARWAARFLFTETARSMSEFAIMCAYQQDAPDSSFRKKRVATLATPGGRVTLLNRTLTELTPEGSASIELVDDGEVLASLAERFGIHLDSL